MNPASVQSLLQPASFADVWTMIAGLGAVVSAVGTVAVAIIAGVGLRSLRLAQSDMVNRATRDARACSIDRCRELSELMIPINSDILEAFIQKDVPVFVNDAKAVTFNDKNEAEAQLRAVKWVSDLAPEVYAKCVNLLNACEAWAMYFTQGLADANVAYRPCAPVFMGWVIQLYPVLIVLRSRDRSGQFANVVELFETWYGKTLDAEADKLLDQVRHLQTKGGAYKRLPDPIGTKPLK